MSAPQVLAVGTALPQQVIGQQEVRQLVEGLFAGMSGLERLLAVFENTGIEQRHLAQPLDWYAQEHNFPQKNAAFFEHARQLSQQASRTALQQAGIAAHDVGAVVMVTSTGVATPSLEAYLMQDLGLPLSAVRLPLWGLGCAGGAAGLARAANLAQVLQKPVLLVAVELCSLTFLPGDRSRSNLVASSLFSDGAAAVVVGWGEGPRIAAGFSELLPNSYEIMGWDWHPLGFQVRFAQSIPSLVENQLPPLLQTALERVGYGTQPIDLHVLHPGGARVLAAYRQALGCSEESLQASWEVLRRCGNMSSPTVLFVLDELLRAQRSGQTGLLLALGPGFSLEGVVLQW